MTLASTKPSGPSTRGREPRERQCLCYSPTLMTMNTSEHTVLLQGDTKKGNFFKCVVAAMYSWQHCVTGTLSSPFSNHGSVERSTEWCSHKNVLHVRVFQKLPVFLCQLVSHSTPDHRLSQTNKQTNSVALVRKRTIPTERPPPVGEVSANFCG
jgi:hypothetical protein